MKISKKKINMKVLKQTSWLWKKLDVKKNNIHSELENHWTEATFFISFCLAEVRSVQVQEVDPDPSVLKLVHQFPDGGTQIWFQRCWNNKGNQPKTLCSLTKTFLYHLSSSAVVHDTSLPDKHWFCLDPAGLASINQCICWFPSRQRGRKWCLFFLANEA